MMKSKFSPSDFDYVWELIESIESREALNSSKFSQVLHEARCAERMKAWEKVIWWAVSGINVS